MKLGNKFNKVLRKCIEVIFITIAFVYIVRFISNGWPQIQEKIGHAKWSDMVLAIGFFWLFFISRFAAWVMAARFYDQRPNVPSAINIWFLSEFSRYVPGNVWSFLGRLYLSDKAGLSKSKIAITMILEVVYLVAASFVFAGMFFVLKPNEVHLPIWPFIVAIPVLVVACYPKLLEKLINKILVWRKKETIDLNLNIKKIVSLLVLYIVAWAAYGYGSYLVTTGLLDIKLSAIWMICAFVLAWLLGYMSIVTPMGLGVREGAILLMLGPIISWPLASFVALVTRLWLMVGELSIMLVVGIINIKHNWSNNKVIIKKWLGQHKYEIVLAVLVISYILYFTIYTFLRHYHFLSAYNDLGNMDQTVWNTANGNFFQMTSIDGAAVVSRMQYHADLLLALFAPLYWIVASPYILLFVQALVLGLGALPLWWLGKDVLKNKPFALLVCFAYLMFPPMQRANIFDFHAVTLVTGLIPFMFYYAYKEKYWKFAVFAILVLLAKENMAFIVIAMGIYIAFKNKKWKIGLGVIGGAMLWFYLLLWQIIPHLRGSGGSHFAMDYYKSLGDSPGEIIKTMIFRPDKWVGKIVNIHGLRYVTYFLAPLGFLALCSPLILIIIPELSINFLSSYWPMQTIYYQYTSAITPIVFIAGIFGIARVVGIVTRIAKNRNWRFLEKYAITIMIIYIAIWSLIVIYRWSPLPGMYRSDAKAWYYRHTWESDINKIISNIPADASVSTTEHFGPHLTHRRNVYHFPFEIDSADYIFVEEIDELKIMPVPEVAIGLRKVERDKRFYLIYEKDSVKVYKKRK